MASKDQITDIFGIIDAFYIDYFATLDTQCIGDLPKRKAKMSTSQVMTLRVLIQLSAARCFKWFYNNYVVKDFSSEFSQLVSYNHLV